MHRRDFVKCGFAAAVRIETGKADLEVSLDPGGFDLQRDAILAWVRQCADAVTAYYGRFPVRRARVEIQAAAGRRGVSRGKSWGYGGAHCRVALGQHATGADLKRDWMLTHEMVHFGFPSVPERHHWIEEGMATYVEPIARAEVGNLTPAEVWHDMIRDMPKGQPGEGDRGLDLTPTWGRTYWGGAMFCLLADVGLRKRTRNALGLRDALRAIARAGGTIEEDWPLERAFETGDKATKTHVLMDLYRELGAKPVTVDLDGLWKELGVRISGGSVVVDRSAPLASIREGIVPEV